MRMSRKRNGVSWLKKRSIFETGGGRRWKQSREDLQTKQSGAVAPGMMSPTRCNGRIKKQAFLAWPFVDRAEIGAAMLVWQRGTRIMASNTLAALCKRSAGSHIVSMAQGTIWKSTAGSLIQISAPKRKRTAFVIFPPLANRKRFGGSGLTVPMLLISLLLTSPTISSVRSIER